MRQVWKYSLTATTKRQLVRMPVGSKVLCVGNHEVSPCCYVLVDPDADLEPRQFLFVETGTPIVGDAILSDYIGTLSLRSSFGTEEAPYIVHLFEVRP